MVRINLEVLVLMPQSALPQRKPHAMHGYQCAKMQCTEFQIDFKCQAEILSLTFGANELSVPSSICLS